MPLKLTYIHPSPSNDALSFITEEQRAEIMLVIQGWALLETMIQKIACALAQSPLHLGQALTEDLGPDHRLKALRRLCKSWLWRRATTQ